MRKGVIATIAAAIVLAGIFTKAAAAPNEARPAGDIVAIPTASGINLQTRVLRPAGDGPFPLAVISHGSPPNAADRPGMQIPRFRSAADWLLERGYIVALPLRRGYGATGGPWAEGFGRCNDPDFYQAGLTTADDIGAAIDFLVGRSDVRRGTILLVGVSAGGWGSVAAASRNPRGVFGVLNFAGGRGGNPRTQKNCVPQRLIDAAGRYGARARIPSLWLYAQNDLLFGPALARSMYDAYAAGGAPAKYIALPAFGRDGHRVFPNPAGRVLWEPPVTDFLATLK